MKINPDIKEQLQKFGIPTDDGLAALLAIYFGISPTYTPAILQSKLMIAGILNMDEVSKTVTWYIPLFEEQVTAFEWVATKWMPMFEAVNKDRKGNARDSISRMKKFFAQNPDVREHEVMEATRMYIRSVDNPAYIMTSHYFIVKGQGAEKTSGLEEWIGRYRSYQASIQGSQDIEDLTNTMTQ